DDLNRIIRRGPVYDPQRFSGATLSPDTANLLAQNPQAGDLVRLNRLLLLDAYAKEMATGHGYSKTTYSLLFLAGLFLAKMIATAATVGSGAVGGALTPTLFLGSALGAAFGLGSAPRGGGSGLRIAPFAVVGVGSMLAPTACP